MVAAMGRRLRLASLVAACVVCAAVARPTMQGMSSVRSANGENKGEYEGPGPIAMDPVDCVLSDWTLWGLCSKSCGDGGTKSRTRRVLLQLRLCAPAPARDPF